MRRPKVNPASITKAPSGNKTNGHAMPSPTAVTASAAIANPNAPLPTSPRKIRARGKLKGRKPTQAATSAHPSHPQALPDIAAANAAATKAAWLAASPLMPSMKFQTLVSTTAAANAAMASQNSP